MDINANETKFIFDPSTLIHEIDSNNIFFKTLRGKFKLSGEDIVLAIHRIISYFQVAGYQEKVLEELEVIYKKDSISNLISFLISKGVLISEDAYNELFNFDLDYLEKYRYFTLGGKTLKEISSEMKSMTIGLICTYQFAKCFFSHFENERMIGSIKCLIIDRANVNKDKCINCVDISCLNSNSEVPIRELIEKSDFIIVNSNYENFSLFSYVNERCLKDNKKWLRVVIKDECAEIGPLFIPNETCCYSCFEKRLIDHVYDKLNSVYFLLEKEQEDFHEKRLNTYSSFYFTLIASDISYYEVMRYFTGFNCPLQGSVLTFFIEGYKMKLDKIFKLSQCDSCHL